MRLTDDEFGELVDEALASMPGEFAPYMENVVVEVRPRPDQAMLKSLRLPRGSLLLGLYSGVPLTRKSVRAPSEMPERIIIFKDNVESVCRTRRQIVRQVRKTVLHEVGHHFGMGEEQLRKLGYA